MGREEYLRLLGKLFYCQKRELREYWQNLPVELREEFLTKLILEDAGILALSRLGPQLLPEETVAKLEEERIFLLTNSLKQESAFRHVFQLFEERGIRYAPIKGIDLAYRIYPSPSLRPFGDWDFLFHPQEMDRVYDCLRKDGWREITEYHKSKNHHHYSPLVKDNYWLEPHWTLPCSENSPAELLWNYMTPQVPGSFHYLLSPELNLLLVARHAASSTYRGMRLTKMLLDAAFIMRKDPIDWEKCRRFCKEFAQPYPGNLFGSFPEFFPAETIACMNPDAELVSAYRRIFETRKMFSKESFGEVVLMEENRFSPAWFKRHFSVYFHPKTMRYKYSLPARGRYGALCLAYIKDIFSKMGRLFNFVIGKRYQGMADFYRLVEKVEGSRTSKR